MAQSKPDYAACEYTVDEIQEIVRLGREADAVAPSDVKLSTADDFREYAKQHTVVEDKALFDQVVQQCADAVRRNPRITEYTRHGTLPDAVIAMLQAAGFSVHVFEPNSSMDTTATTISWK